MLARMHTSALAAEPDRVIGQLFLPGEESSQSTSRATEIVARVLALAPQETEEIAARLIRDFAPRHPDVKALFLAHADAVRSRWPDPTEIAESRRIVMGASFTAEYALEGAALCNPSAVEHPDQTGIDAGRLRVAVALRAIGEGHLSSIGFAEAIIGPGRSWEFLHRDGPPWRPALGEGEWHIAHFRAAAEHEGILREVSHAVLRTLPERFVSADVEAAIAGLPNALSARADSGTQIDSLRRLAASAYRARFADESSLSQRVLTPVAAEEDHGMEDARFVRFTGTDGSVHYRATYTAYDGREIAPRLITTPDLRDFAVHRLTGDAAHNKGMALFPHRVGGRHLALCRTDGENISLAESDDGLAWRQIGKVHGPEQPWEIVQTGNCGAPLETEHGWIVLTHGVGPMRTYVLGALLLDLDDPTIVIGRTTVPILEPARGTRDGYVPNVVYSCGGLIHDGVLWIPLGIADAQIGVCSVEVSELLSTMSAPPTPGP